MVQQLLFLCSVCNSGSIRYIRISLKRNDLIFIMPFASFDDDIIFFDFIDQAIGCIHAAAIFAVFTFELFRLSDAAMAPFLSILLSSSLIRFSILLSVFCHSRYC